MQFVSGGLGGGIDSIFTMPFDTVKTQMQLNKQMGSSAFGCARQIVIRDGIAGLYRGYVPFGVMATGKAGIRWGSVRCFERLADMCGVDRAASRQTKAKWSFLCGFGGGFIEAIVWTAPQERLKTLRQRSAGLAVQTVSYREIFATHQIAELWKGTTPTMMRSATNGAVRFAVADTVKECYNVAFGISAAAPSPLYVQMLSGGTGGAISTICNNPVDVIKSKMQAGHEGSWLSCVRAIRQERGILGFYAGLTSRLPQIFLSQAIQFAVVDTFKTRA